MNTRRLNTALLGLILFLNRPASFAANLALNPGFESGNGTWRWEAWKMDPACVQFQTDSHHVHSGTSSFQITNLRDDDSWIFQEVPVQESSIYKVSGWVRTKNVSGIEGIHRENIGACLCIKNTWIRSKDLKGTRGWTLVDFLVRTGPNQKTLPIACRLGYWYNTVRGTAWFDDIEVVPIVDSQQEDIPVYDTSPPKNPESRGRPFMSALFTLAILLTSISIYFSFKNAP